MTPDFDVAIVGARCAGAALAVRLRRAGMSVALLDAAALPSDQPMSTHFLQPPALDELDALGVGERVRASAPALRAGRFGFDDQEMLLRYHQDRPAYCLRRSKLDVLLQDAAVNAGAALQPQSRVVGVIRASDGRVAGVHVRRADGRVEPIGARTVVGADGWSSTIAKLVGAEEYLGYEGPRATYWAYWRRPRAWDPALFFNGSHGLDMRVLFPCDDDLVLIATCPPNALASAWRRQHTAAYIADVRGCGALAAMLGTDEPVSEVRGCVRLRYFFRTAAGPGWALAGDAGHHKEFTTGLGITDALRDARDLAAALVEGGDDAVQRYWRRRDVEHLVMFRWGQDFGSADRVSAVERLVVARVATEPDLGVGLGDVMDGRRSPYDLVPPARVLAWVVAAAVRGELAPLPALAKAVARTLQVRRELRRRTRVLSAITKPRVLGTFPGASDKGRSVNHSSLSGLSAGLSASASAAIQ